MKKVTQGFQKQEFMKTIGAELGKIGPGKCEIILPFNKKLTQQHGLFHGGVLATIADNSAGFAAYTLMENGYQPLTIEFKINLVSSTVGKNVISKAKVLRAGRQIFHVRSDVFSINVDQEILIATSLITIKSSKSLIEINNF